MQRTPNLFETLLVAAGAEEFLPAFKKNKIDLSSFLIITDEDLQIIGVQDIKLRQAILEQRDVFAKSRRRLDFTIDEHHVNLIMKEMDWQLRFIEALVWFSAKGNVQRTETKIHDAAASLAQCVDSFHKELQSMDNFINPKPPEAKTVLWNGVALVVLASALSFYTIRKFVK